MKKKAILLILLAVCFTSLHSQKVQTKTGFSVELKNGIDLKLEDIIVKIELSEILKNYPDFNFTSYIIKEKDEIKPAELLENYNSKGAVILVNLSFLPNETKTLDFVKWDKAAPQLVKRTQAYLGQKTGYKRVDKYYKEGKFESVTSTKVPKDHFAHDALYQFEGPGWESDKVAYRFYLDDRNRTDIFGKTTSKVILDIVGATDLDSGNEGYQNPQDWGMDIFKVGNSLGLGAIATMDSGKVVTVSETDSVKCKIVFNNNLYSKIRTTYSGWKVGDKKYDLSANVSINAGSRLTKTELSIKGDIPNICTGIAKHDSTEYIESAPVKKGSWGYIALYGYQSRDGNKLGLAVFYKKSELIKTGESTDSKLITLKPDNGKVTYYFAAAWEKEPNGIKTRQEFEKYLEETCKMLGSSIKVSFPEKINKK